jgi:hypothetical protein
MLTLLLLSQAAGPPDVQAVRPRPLAAQPCGVPDAAGDVVVCGRRGDSPYRLKALPPAPDAPALPPAQVTLPGGGTVTAHGEKGSLGPIPTNRAMVTLKLPF